ncbi:hypothetical protein POTOM_037312 [Populus tomentosa]|uniref:Legume lectin domain-containing protein n=1 Tax=Populus tomentosa TaxID=118781 RepID=A0A8X8CKB0_POPTO|nr:hypothetical protein POTOM_037312 [Populus tomentosa]
MTQQLMEPYHIQGSTQKCMKVASLFLVVRIKLKTNGGDVLLSSPMKIEEQQDELTKSKFVGSEFDTRLDAHFKDPNDHHVCLDIDSLNSIKIAEPILQVELLEISTFSVEVNGGLTPCGRGSGGARILPDARRIA